MKQGEILKRYCELHKINVTRIGRALDVTRPNVYKLFESQYFSDATLTKIRQAFPDFEQFTTDLVRGKYTESIQKNLAAGHTPTIPILSTDQGNVLLMSINAASYAAIEMLCRVVSNQENIPIEQVRVQANQLTHERQRLVEQVLDRLVSVVPSDNTKKTDSN